MEEVFFLVEEMEAGYTAKGLEISIFTQAEAFEELRIMVKDAVKCHFDDVKKELSGCILLEKKLLHHEIPSDLNLIDQCGQLFK